MEKNLNILTREWVYKAYKKLKSYLYFDKTQLPLVDDLVAFESEGIEENISTIVQALKGRSDGWEDFTADILEKIDVDFNRLLWGVLHVPFCPGSVAGIAGKRRKHE